MATEPVYSEDGVVDARVRQKVGTDSDFGNIVPLSGEVAWVRKEGRITPWNFKIGDGVTSYDELEFALDVYTKDEVWNKNETFNKANLYNRAQIDTMLQPLKTGYRGIAVPSTDPKGNVLGYYTSTTPGIYTNFGNLVVEAGFSYIAFNKVLNKWEATTVEPTVLLFPEETDNIFII